MPKLIQVAGDLITDVNVLRLPDARARQDRLAAGLGLRRYSGGASFLKEVVRHAVADLDDVEVVLAAHPEQPVTESLSLWAGQPSGSASHLRTWRIQERLGLFEAQQSVATSAPGPAPAGVPDLVVLDNRGLAFRDEPAWWPPALTDGAAPEIVLKLSGRLTARHLWQTLIERHADRLTVVIDAATLRSRNANISRSLSWDRTLEELETELNRGDSVAGLARARRVFILFPGAAVARFERGSSAAPTLTRFVFLPDELEGAHASKFRARVPGALSFLTAAVTRHLAGPVTKPDFVALARATAATRALMEAGAGSYDARSTTSETAIASFRPESIPAILSDMLHQSEQTPTERLPERRFRAAVTGFPELDRSGSRASDRRDLFADAVGHGHEYVASIAMQAALRGPEEALRGAPFCRFGHFLTYDRSESERLNELRRLIETYRANPLDRRPLSIAVFGPPGSGKSFAIKELAREIFAGSQTILEFNLSQCGDHADLRAWFEQIRDAGIRNSIPLVFWDEFDTNDLSWLADFLAPMQDSSFMADAIARPIGKAIFIFAGGTMSTFDAFDRSSAQGATGQAFRDRKGPDFISRLRGYLDVKGPNPSLETERGNTDDLAHLVRRAILFRSSIIRYFPHLLDVATGTLSVSASVVRGFLRAERYHHGARSLEAIISMSDLAGAASFGPGQLPSAELLALHVTPDFIGHIADGDLEEAIIHDLAASMHDAWRGSREADGWSYAPARDDAAKHHPLLVSFDRLEAADQERNLRSARLALAKLSDAGLRAVAPSIATDQPGGAGTSTALRERLVRIEHETWLREHLVAGYAFGEETNERLLLHRDIASYDDLPVADRDLDGVIVDAALNGLRSAGYRLVSVE